MTTSILFVIAGTALVFALNTLRPMTLSRYSIPWQLDRALTFLVYAFFVLAVFFFVYFLAFGAIPGLPANIAGVGWLVLTILLLLSGVAGVLLFRDPKRGNLAMMCVLLGYLSLSFYVISNTNVPA